MPFFEYTCEKCDNEFEILIFAGEEDGVKCSKCGSKEIHKQVSASSFMGTSMGKCASNAPKEFS